MLPIVPRNVAIATSPGSTVTRGGRMFRAILKGAVLLLGFAALALAAWFGINATDEPLSAEAQALLSIRKPPAPSERNGFLDLAAIHAPATFDRRLTDCRNDYFACLAAP